MSAFEELGICPEIIQAVEEDDWLLPTPVQQEARPGDRRRPEETGGDRRRPEETGGDRRRPDFGKVMKNVTEEPDGTSIWNIIIVCIYIYSIYIYLYIYIYYIFMDTLRLDTQATSCIGS